MKALAGYFERLANAVDSLVPSRARGRVVAANGDEVVTEGLSAPVGASVLVGRVDGSTVQAEVVSADSRRRTLALLEPAEGIAAGNAAEFRAAAPTAGASERLLGRILNCLGTPVDGMGAVSDLEPVPLRCGSRGSVPLALPHRLDLDGVPGLFRGAKVALRAPWPLAGSRIATIARSWRKPIVSLLVGGSLFEHSVFSADLTEAFYRSVTISEPGHPKPYRALRAYRLATTLTSWFASCAGEALLLVVWRLAARPTPADITAPHDLTAIWTIEEEAAGFDLVIDAAVSEGRAA